MVENTTPMTQRAKILQSQKITKIKNLKLSTTITTPRVSSTIMPMTQSGWMTWTSFAHLPETNDENNH
jgi:hypothetical protein